MIALDVKQGGEEWLDARIGIPTASNFKKIITTKGAISDQRTTLLFDLVEERLLGVKKKTYESAAMNRGVELEPEARDFFQFASELHVEEVGLCYFDERKDRGCSPDGLIGKTQGFEAKCPSLAVHAKYLESNKLPTEHFQQVQGCLYITGRDQWHFFSYFPGVKPFHIIVERDEMWIAKLSKALDDFNIELNEIYKNLSEG
ncbi:hypothetical protein MNBD_GAMMA01-1305 [hydrothermal vent metagenome]|uniref:YqaJ viral recombinase domain-containing protein n=1 Tax=hydrothermal vent metagenome TaxID=652676 RepID=A0A3B0VKM6_9ZZZZ